MQRPTPEAEEELSALRRDVVRLQSVIRVSIPISPASVERWQDQSRPACGTRRASRERAACLTLAPADGGG